MNRFHLLLFTISICTLVLFNATAFAQTEASLKAEKVKATLIHIDGGAHGTGGDFGALYGFTASAGGGLYHKMNGNWVIGLDVHYLFGNSITDTLVAQNLKNDRGNFIGIDGLPGRVNFLQAGWMGQFKLGKLISRKNLPNSGLLMLGGIGYMRHQIRFEDVFDTVPQLQGEYAKGYDRLSTGWMLSQYIGYLHLGPKKRINFHVGIELGQGFTEGKRDYLFDISQSGRQQRFEFLYGIRAGWILPLYGNVINETRYYKD